MELVRVQGANFAKGARNMDLKTTDVFPTETVANIQSAGCKAQKKSVIGAHNRCWKYLIGAISTHGEATRDLEFIGGDKDRQLKQLWTETRIGDILPWDEIADEAERLLESDQANRHVPDDDHVDKEQEDDQGVDRDETDPYNETIFGRRRPDSIHHHQGSLARGTGEGMRMHTCLEINRVVLKSHWWKRHQ